MFLYNYCRDKKKRSALNLNVHISRLHLQTITNNAEGEDSSLLFFEIHTKLKLIKKYNPTTKESVKTYKAVSGVFVD